VHSFLESNGIAISMNPESAPWRNGSQEPFFGRFKVELADMDRFDTWSELLDELYQQLMDLTFQRIKTELRMSPAKFRQDWLER